MSTPDHVVARHIRIVLSSGGRGALYIDGEELHGIFSLRVEGKADEAPRVHVELMGYSLEIEISKDDPAELGIAASQNKAQNPAPNRSTHDDEESRTGKGTVDP